MEGASCPPLDDLLKFREALGQSSGTGLQDQGRFDLVEVLVLHRRSSVGPGHHPLGPEFLAAPGANDQIRLARDHLIDGHHTIIGCGMACTIGKDVDAAGDLDELRDASNPGDQRIVPFL
jgi:hypothetical protein